ncbi:MAG: hypothetical protein ACR2KV_09945 [Solirubrobacteraceae bacterium]
MAPDDPQPAQINVPFSWVGFDEVPIAYANHFLVQIQPEGGIVIGIGQGMLPTLIGTPEEIAEQVAQIEFVPVNTLSRIAVAEAKAKELIAVLHASIDNAEKIRQTIDPRGG